MSLISYAQNHEDIILWRALSGVNKGFYIDVGAAWPDIDSVTKVFYDNSWSGINIEPNPALFSKLSAARGRDINLQIAISNHPGKADIFLIGETGISTFETEIAARHATVGWVSTKVTVAVETLAAVWSQHIPTGQEVHFLKVDVEGLEKAVLSSNDWTRYRPWIIVVEATLPLSQVESYESWEYILLATGYTFVYADGLNRFYLAAEHNELQPAFKYPPNLFDGFISHTELSLRQVQERVQTLEAELQERVQTLEAELQVERESTYQWWATAYYLKQEITAIHRSLSWRLAAPFRRLKRGTIWPSAVSTVLSNQVKRLIHQAIQWGMTIVAKQPMLKTHFLSLLNKNPKLDKQIRRLLARNRAAASTTAQNSPSWAVVEGLTDSELSILNRRVQLGTESPDAIFQAIAREITLSPEARVLSSQPKED